MISRDALERGVEDFAGRCRPSRTLPPSWWHCALKRGASRSSGDRVTTFSSAGRPPLLVRAEKVSAPLERSIRTTRRAPMRAEVEDHALLVAMQGRPSPLPRQLQQFGACSRQEAASIDIRRRHMHAESSVQLPSTNARRSCGNVLAAVDPWTASATLLPPNHGRITS